MDIKMKLMREKEHLEKLASNSVCLFSNEVLTQSHVVDKLILLSLKEKVRINSRKV